MSRRKSDPFPARAPRVHYRPGYGLKRAVAAYLLETRPDGLSVVAYKHGANWTFDHSARRGGGEFGGWWPLKDTPPPEDAPAGEPA